MVFYLGRVSESISDQYSYIKIWNRLLYPLKKKRFDINIWYYKILEFFIKNINFTSFEVRAWYGLLFILFLLIFVNIVDFFVDVKWDFSTQLL